MRPELLDVADSAAVAGFADPVGARHGGVDVGISNAAARLRPGAPAAKLVESLVATNNLGTTRMLRCFDPLLRPGGRILVVASDNGSLDALPTHLHERFDTDAMTLDDIDATILAWRDAVIEGRSAREGWPEWINIPSKVGQVAAVRVAARQRSARGEADGRLVAAVCPGLTDTEGARTWFGAIRHAQTPTEAARAPLRLALDPLRPELNGELVQFGEVIPWRSGGVARKPPAGSLPPAR